MVELYVFAPGEKIDAEEFSEVTLVTNFFRDFALPVVDQPSPHDRVRLAVRRAGFVAKSPAPVNPLSVACPKCHQPAWDACWNPAGVHAKHTHQERHDAARKPPQ